MSLQRSTLHAARRQEPFPLGRILLLAFISAVFLTACGGSDPTDTPDPPDPPEECERDGVPCALADVPLEILERGEALGLEVRSMLEGGATTADARGFLEGEPDVVDLLSDEVAVVFRIEGGRPIWVLRRGASGPVVDVDPAAPRATLPPTSAPSARVVVGDGSASKRALVLSPFRYEFGVFDDGAAVAGILSGTRGYDGNVVYEENAGSTSTAVGIEDFMGWDAYDVVHVTSHGRTVCDLTNCTAVIRTGDTYGTAEELLQIEVHGVNTVMMEGDDRAYYGVGADFFAETYPDGLTDTIVFFNACQTFSDDDQSRLADAVRGATGVFLGWSEAVPAGNARDAALAFYEALGEDGRTAEEAWASLGPLLGLTFQHEGQTVTTELRYASRQAGGDLRAREVIELRHPTNGSALAAGGSIPAIGTLGDGQPDAVPFRVRVDGVEPGDADMYAVTVTIQGTSVGPITLGTGQQLDARTWEVEGQVHLPADLSDGQSVTLRAETTLPDGGTSVHELAAIVVGANYVVTFESTIETEVTLGATVTTISSVEAEVEVTGGQGSAVLEYVSFDYVSDLGGCTFESSTVDGTLAVVGLTLSPDDIANAELLLAPSNEINEEIVQTCGNLVQTLPAVRYWWNGWNALHSGALDDGADETTDEGAWRITDWAEGPGATLARRTYVREGIHELTGVTYRESTTIEIR